MSFLKKIGHSLRHGFSVGSPKKIFGKKAYKWVKNPLRAAQRSHKLGHTLAPSSSNQNQITRAYNKLLSSMSRSAQRAAERQMASEVGNSANVAAYNVPHQRMDYSYRRLSDLT